ncbi:MAG: hypothetical protein HKN58_03575 [Xanthomonadales bacterium]|nr:hypothetical protein [Xanthomonadales bacterium]
MQYSLVALLLLLLADPAYALQSDDANADEDIRYVQVDSSSNDALILDGTDFFEANPLCRLIANQQVTVLGEKDGKYIKIRAVCDGKSVEGWVRKSALGKKPREHKPEVTPSGGIDSASIAAPASVDHGIIRPPESEDDGDDDEP